MSARFRSAEQLADALHAFSISRLITTAVSAGLFDAVGEAGTVTVDALAGTLAWQPDKTARAVRALASAGLVETAGDAVRLSNTGRLLVDGAAGSLAPMARMLHRDGWTAWTGLPGWLSADRSERDVFDDFDSDATGYAVFAHQMTAGSAHHAPAVVTAAALAGTESILDVGGGSGAMARAFLTAHGAVHVTVGDRAYARAGAQAYLQPIPAHRWSFTDLDFFREVPAGYDVYLLSRVLHDWDDDKAKKILSTCRAAMGHGARLLVFERSTVARATTAFRMADLNTGLMCGGRERTVDEFADLLDAVGLRVDRVVPVTGEHLLIEAR